MSSNRRAFLKVVGATPVVATASAQLAPGTTPATKPAASSGTTPAPVSWPRRFTGDQLSMIAFPLGGIGAGSIALGGRGQLRDWEIFNRPEKATRRLTPTLRSGPNWRARSQ